MIKTQIHTENGIILGEVYSADEPLPGSKEYHARYVAEVEALRDNVKHPTIAWRRVQLRQKARQNVGKGLVAMATGLFR